MWKIRHPPPQLVNMEDQHQKRRERGPEMPASESGHLLAQIGVRVGAALLVLSMFALVAVGSEDYSGFTTACATVLAVSLLLIGFGAFRLHRERQAPLATQPDPGESVTRCPHCAKSIQAGANVCRYCGRDVAPSKAEVDDLRAGSA